MKPVAWGVFSTAKIARNNVVPSMMTSAMCDIHLDISGPGGQLDGCDTREPVADHALSVNDGWKQKQTCENDGFHKR